MTIGAILCVSFIARCVWTAGKQTRRIGLKMSISEVKYCLLSVRSILRALTRFTCADLTQMMRAPSRPVLRLQTEQTNGRDFPPRDEHVIALRPLAFSS